MAKLHGAAKAAFKARMAAGRTKASHKGKKKRVVGRKRAAKVVRTVAKATVTETKKIKKAAKKIAKKVAKKAAPTHHGHRPKKVRVTKMQTAVAAAAKRVADQCASELKEVRAKAEMALALGNIGRGLRSATSGGPHHRYIKGLKSRIHHLRHKAAHPADHPAQPHAHPAHHGRRGKAKSRGHHGPHAVVFPGAARPIHAGYVAGHKGKKKKGHKAKHHPAHHGAEREVSASQIMGGMKVKGSRAASRKGKDFNFWVCAGPVRTGCGHGGSHVLGDQTKHKAIRLR